MVELDLNKRNRLLLARAYANIKRVDISIDCVIEGQMGRAYTDSLEHPTVFKIEVGPFSYFAGDAGSPGAREMIGELQPYASIMPCPDGWLQLAQTVHGDKLTEYARYSFSSDTLSVDHLRTVLEKTGLRAGIARIDEAAAIQLQNDPNHLADFSSFDSPKDFTERGIGFYTKDGDAIIGVAYSSLVCSTGIEVSIVVAPTHRRQGIATALACTLLDYCLEHHADPHWDAANPESCKLAEKLGYTFTEKYLEHYVRRESPAQ